MPSRIVKVASPTHPVSVELNGLKGSVKLSGAKPMDSDFVMTVQLQAPHEPRAWVETTRKFIIPTQCILSNVPYL